MDMVQQGSGVNHLPLHWEPSNSARKVGYD